MKNSIANKKIGLALGGGGALGLAHIGVLRAIEECNITIHFITGTSIGALVSAFYAFGISWREMEKIAEDIGWMDIGRITLSKYGLLSNKKLESLLCDQIGDVSFDQSNIPLAIVATNISNGEKVILNKGSVIAAVMASTCIPGIFVPVEIDDILLVDGGIVENVPLSPLKKMNADLLIGVDLNAKHFYKRPDHIIDVLTNSFHFALKTITSLQTEEADILIKPDLSLFNRTAISQTTELIEAGYLEGKKMLEGLLQSK